MEYKKYNKLVNIIKKKQTYREQTSGYQWGEGKREGQYRSEGKQRVIMGLHKIICVKLKNYKAL